MGAFIFDKIRKWKTLFLIISVRVLSVFMVRTWYVPDEFWQSLEVAHHLIFKYGYLTWEWHEGIRSYLYPLTISALYKTLQLLNIDTVFTLTIIPRVLQAIVTGIAEYKLYCWCNRSKWTLFTILTSWFVFYTGSRTLLNTIEYALTAITITQFPWGNEDNFNFLFTIGLGTIIRPTFAIPWVPLCLYHLFSNKYVITDIVYKRYVPIIMLMILLSISIDTFASGNILFSHWNFIKLNVLEDIGSFYGSHPWHWYFTVGLPTIMSFSFIPFTFAVAYIIRDKFTNHIQSLLLASILFTLIVYSFIPHKEFRFLLSILPMILVVTSKYLSKISMYKYIPTYLLLVISIAIGVFNLIPIYYIGWIHQSGTIMVMPKLLNNIENYSAPKVLFLMPCHSTPYYSHVHKNITMRFLTCEPDAKYNGIADEADIFYNNPQKWLNINYFDPIQDQCKDKDCYEEKVQNSLPTHLIMFEDLKDQIAPSLKYYKEIERLFHTHFSQGRISSYILIYELNVS